MFGTGEQDKQQVMLIQMVLDSTRTYYSQSVDGASCDRYQLKSVLQVHDTWQWCDDPSARCGTHMAPTMG